MSGIGISGARRFPWGSPALFGLVLIGFLLPFVDLSCAGERFATLTGANLALGTKPVLPSEAAEAMPKEASSRCGVATLAWACAVLGLVLGVRSSGASTRGQMVCAAAGTALLLGLKPLLESQIRESGEGMIDLSFRSGYWLTVLGMLACAALNGWQSRASPPS